MGILAAGGKRTLSRVGSNGKDGNLGKTHSVPRVHAG